MTLSSLLEAAITGLVRFETVMQKEKLPRREREKLRQRQEILTAGLTLFSEKGFHNVSMHEIAEEAEFAIGTLYKFFQNKEDLYRALVLEQCSLFAAAFNEALEQGEDEIEKLRNYVRAQYKMFRSHLPFVRLFIAESRGVSYSIKAGLDQELRARYYRLLEKIASVFESGIRNKRFGNIASPYHLAVSLDSTIHAFLLLCLDEPEKHPFPEDPDTILNIFFQGMLNG